MNFTRQVKTEILSVRLNGDNVKRAFISAFLRTCGAIEVESDKFGFSVTSDNQTLNHFCKIFKLQYKQQCVASDGAKKDRSTAKLVNESTLAVLIDLGILKFDGEDLTLSLSIGDIVCSVETFKAYIMGAFLGSGSVTAPDVENKAKSKTGYHLEVVFSKYVTASDFCMLLADYGFMPKLVERKDQFIVYFKSVEEIENFIGLCGANSAYLKLTEVQIKKGIRNAENRKINCEMSNLTKSIDASIKQREDITTILELIGEEGLSEPLRVVAVARLENEDMSLQQLADKIGVSKSCLSHRLRKLSEIAATLR